MSDNFDPYHTWLGIPPTEQPPNHYRLLAIPLYEADSQTIQHAADRQMAHLRTLQTGKYGGLSQRLLNEVAAARLCLLNPEKKPDYRRGIYGKGMVRFLDPQTWNRRRRRLQELGGPP
ncbi:MAG: hypothetical protein ACYTG0_32895 [Planctomycetota bacterium]|jgi:hypothetical protein